MTKGKVPKKPITSPAIQEEIEDFLTAEGKKLGVPVYVDNPPAGRFGKTGRPDLFCDFGPIHFRIEVKTRPGDGLADNQQDYARRDGVHCFGRTFAIHGLKELDYFKANFYGLLATMLKRQELVCRHMMDTWSMLPEGTMPPPPDFDLDMVMGGGQLIDGTLQFNNANRIVMRGKGLAKMYDDKHIQVGAEGTDEMDKPA